MQGRDQFKLDLVVRQPGAAVAVQPFTRSDLDLLRRDDLDQVLEPVPLVELRLFQQEGLRRFEIDLRGRRVVVFFFFFF